MFEREFAGVRKWQRGANRISAVDFEYRPLPSGEGRGMGSARTTHGPRHDIEVDAQSDGIVGIAFGVSRQTVGALRRGEFPFEARCDLHKLHADAARRRLHQFVEECVRRDLRAGLLICGRGAHSGPEGPVLAGVVTSALAQPPLARHVLAFTPAPAEHGGKGAIAVLFRRSPPSRPR